MLYSTIHSDMEVDEKSVETAPLSATAALKQTTQILSSTTKTTKAVLSTVADTKWWQSTIKSLKQPTKRQMSETVVYDNDKFEKQGCHPFYEDFIQPCHPDFVSLYIHLLSVSKFNLSIYTTDYTKMKSEM